MRTYGTDKKDIKVGGFAFLSMGIVLFSIPGDLHVFDFLIRLGASAITGWITGFVNRKGSKYADAVKNKKMPKAIIYDSEAWSCKAVRFHCPGCEDDHSVPVSGDKAWIFNDSIESPTLSPSISTNGFYNGKQQHCHSYVTAGQIHFLSDSTHKLAGQSVSLPNVE